MLRVWTQSKSDSALRTIFSPLLSGSGVKHKFYGASYDLDEIKVKEGELLLVMGEPLLPVLKSNSIVPKNLGIGKLRERVYPYQDGHVMLSYAPGIIYANPRHEPEVHWDAKLAMRWLTTGTLRPQTGHYHWVDDFSQLWREVKAMYKASGYPVPVAGDLETIGFDPYAEGARIVSVTFSVEEGESFVYRVPEDGMPPKRVLKQIKKLCTSKKVKMVGANLKFDSHWTDKHWEIRVTNQKFDTMLVGSLLNENMANSLNIHAKMDSTIGGYDDPFSEKHDKSRMDLVLEDDPEGFLTYAGGDTDACLQVYHKQRTRLMEDERLVNFYMNLVQPVADAFVAVERRGIVVDRNRYEELKVEVSQEKERLHSDLVSMLPRKMRIKYRDDLKLTRPVILKEFFFTPKGLNLDPIMFTEKTGQPSTSMNHLKRFSDNEDAAPFVSKLKELNSAQKTLSTYIIGFMKYIRSDGKFHPTFYLGNSDMGGTNTGRTSARDPAIQTLVKHTKWAKPLRSVFVPPEGYALMSADFSQGELRVCACVANERKMINAYRKNIDMHLLTGVGLNNMSLNEALRIKSSGTEDERETVAVYRQGGKSANFGLIYEISAEGYREYVLNTFDVNMPLEKAQSDKKGFFDLYPGLVEWQHKYHKLAQQHGYVRSPLGRVRHLPFANSRNPKLKAQSNRQSVNSPIQSTLSDMCTLSIALLYQRYPELWVWGFTHDSIDMYVPIDEIELWGRRVKETMESLPLDRFNWHPQLEFPADVEYSLTNFAECKELDLSS